MLDCDCLLFAVRDVESFARGRGHQAIERAVIRLFIAFSSPRGDLVRLPNLSLGPYQLRISTVGRFLGVPLLRNGRWVLLQRHSAREVLTECLDERRAAQHARHRVHEALVHADRVGMDTFAAIAMVYSGELPTALVRPYEARLRKRYNIRHRTCESAIPSPPPDFGSLDAW
jgi:hypothetical protein